MKNAKTLAIVGILLVCVTAAAGAFVVKGGFNSRLSGPEILPASTIDGSTVNSDLVAVLTKESGDVKFKLPSETEYHEMTTEEVNITSGTSVQTGDGLAHVLLPSNSVMSVSEHAEVVVSFAEKSTSIKQLLGSTWNRVEKVLEGQTYEVETPNTLATVRGTEFNVAVADANNSNIYVVESVTGVEFDDTKDPDDKPTLLKADQQVAIDGKAVPKIGPMSTQVKNSSWAKRNLAITEEIEKAEKEAVPTKAQRLEATGKPGNTQSEDKPDDSKVRSIRKSILEKVKNDDEVKKIDINKKDRTEVLERNEKTFRLLSPTTKAEPTKADAGRGGEIRQEKPTSTPENKRTEVKATETPKSVENREIKTKSPTTAPTATPKRESVKGASDDQSKVVVRPTSTPVPPTKEPVREPTKEPTHATERMQMKVEPTAEPTQASRFEIKR